MIIDGFLGDRLYSVTLDEDEYALFSELEERKFGKVSIPYKNPGVSSLIKEAKKNPKNFGIFDYISHKRGQMKSLPIIKKII